MFAQIENRKGEKLYIITILSTNDVMPHTIVNTWEECRNKFEMITKELDNKRHLTFKSYTSFLL